MTEEERCAASLWEALSSPIFRAWLKPLCADNGVAPSVRPACFGWNRPEQRARLGTVWVDQVVFFGCEVRNSGEGRTVEVLYRGLSWYPTVCISFCSGQNHLVSAGIDFCAKPPNLDLIAVLL